MLICHLPPCMTFQEKHQNSLSLEIAIDETTGQWPFYLEPGFLLPRSVSSFSFFFIIII
jgi:hypothetical protein